MRISTITYAEFGTLVIDGVTEPFSSSPPIQDTDLVMTVTGEDLVIRTGVNMGPVNVVLERHPHAPELEGEGAWDDVVEVSGRTISGVPVSVHGPTELPTEGIGEVGLTDGASVTLRIHAACRGEAHDLAVDHTTERYLIQVWTSPEGAAPRGSTRTRAWSAVSPEVIGEVSPG